MIIKRWRSSALLPIRVMAEDEGKTKRLEIVGDLGRTRKGSERMNVRESVLEEDS
jgi:hypothetical protein